MESANVLQHARASDVFLHEKQGEGILATIQSSLGGLIASLPGLVQKGIHMVIFVCDVFRPVMRRQPDDDETVFLRRYIDHPSPGRFLRDGPVFFPT